MILDSDIIIYFLNGNQKVVDKVLTLERLTTTQINRAELLYGAYNSKKVSENLSVIGGFLSRFEVLEFDRKASEIFAKTKAKLKQNGNIVADMDLMIASIAIANNRSLITNNHKHFKRIENLVLNEWL